MNRYPALINKIPMNTVFNFVNAHRRDSKIRFQEEGHVYTVESDSSKYTSCTELIHTFFQKFEADRVIEQMMRSKKWNDSKYFGLTREEIKRQWDENRDLGTLMHKNIESYLTGKFDNVEDCDVPHFVSFYDNILSKLTPYRTEWAVFDDIAKIAGSIDFVSLNDDGTLDIYDWKRTPALKRENPWACGKGILSHIPDSNFWHYSLQLNLYARIVSEFYGKVVNKKSLVILHPERDSYEIIEVPNLKKEIENIISHKVKTESERID